MPPLQIQETTLAGRDARVLELCRPEKGNCLNLDLLRRMIEAANLAPTSVLFLRGRGPTFCTGLDLQEVYTARSAAVHLELLIELFATLAAHPSPTVSLAEGPAYGGGVGLACCTDVTLAVSEVKFVLPREADYRPLVNILIPVITARRNVARSTVEAWIGAEMSAHEAERLGLVHRVIEGCPDAGALPDLDDVGVFPAPIAHRGLSGDVQKQLAGLLESAITAQATERLMTRLDERFGERAGTGVRRPLGADS